MDHVYCLGYHPNFRFSLQKFVIFKNRNTSLNNLVNKIKKFQRRNWVNPQETSRNCTNKCITLIMSIKILMMTEHKWQQLTYFVIVVIGWVDIVDIFRRDIGPNLDTQIPGRTNHIVNRVGRVEGYWQKTLPYANFVHHIKADTMYLKISPRLLYDGVLYLQPG